MKKQEKLKYPPFPLSTVELQKRASRYFCLSSEHRMKVHSWWQVSWVQIMKLWIFSSTFSLFCSHDALPQVAEDLYQAGFISYPRTETDKFSMNTDLQVSGFWFSIYINSKMQHAFTYKHSFPMRFDVLDLYVFFEQH